MSSAVAAVEQGVRELTLQDPVPVYSQETLHAVFSCVFEYLSPEDCLWARCSTLMRDIGNAEWQKRFKKLPSESVLREKEMSLFETLKEQEALRKRESAETKLKSAIEDEQHARGALAQAKTEHVDVVRLADDTRERIAALERETKVAHEAFEDAQRVLAECRTAARLLVAEGKMALAERRIESKLLAMEARRRFRDVRKALSTELRSSKEKAVLEEFSGKAEKAKRRREREAKEGLMRCVSIWQRCLRIK